MIYCVFEYGGKDRVTTCDEVHQATTILDQVEEAKSQRGCSAFGFVNDTDMEVHLYPDPARIDLIARIKKAVDDYTQ